MLFDFRRTKLQLYDAIKQLLRRIDVNIQSFLGWCLVINVAILFISTVSLSILAGWASRMHAKMFGLDESFVRQSYFTYLANYKIAVIVFNLAPWLAMNLMG